MLSEYAKRYSLFGVISFFQITLVYSQTPSYYHYTSSDGLASSTVFDIIQDKDGFIWFGTLNGLSRFDGRHFTTFSVDDGLNSNVITSVSEGDSGEIYIGNYERGINVLRNGRIVNYRNQINGKSFSTSYLTKYQGRIYSYTNAGRIIVINENTDAGLSDHIIDPHPVFLCRLAKLSDNRLIALTSHGLFVISNDKLIKMNIIGLPDTNLYCLTERSDSSYFIGARGVIYHIKKNHVIKRYRMNSYYDKLFYQIFCDRSNNIWFSILGKGFFLIPNNSDVIIDLGNKMGLGNTQVDNFFEDSEGNIWICTYGKGVYCLNNLYVRNYTEKDGLNNNNVNCVVKEKSGKFLIGTINGINILENGVIDRLTDNSGKVLSGYINSIRSYSDYTYVCWAPETPEIRDVSHKGLKFRFMIDPSFLKTANGLYVFGGFGNNLIIQKEFNHRKTPSSQVYPIFGDSFIQNRVNVITEDSRNNIWVGTSMGLCKLSGISGKSATTPWKKTFFTGDPVLSSKISAIYQDNKNNVWFAGVKGIARYDLENNSVTSYTSMLGYDLSSSTSIVSDNKNRTWVGNMKGLYLLEGNSIKFLNSQTGLPSDEVLSLYYEYSKNLLYVGTSDGISLLDVSLFDGYKHSPLDVKINGIRAGDSLYTDYDNLVFEPAQNNVYINFVAQDYSSPGAVTYKYILNGDSTETNNGFLDFSSLENGAYRLQLMAKTRNADWGKPYLLNFYVKPHFRETIWYKLGIVLIFTFASLSVVVWRMRVKNKKISEQLDLTERINALKHQALSAMMNSHFIFNSLNSVQYLVNCGRLEEANDYIAMMAKLMRKNLDTAGNGFILLSEEISRLRLYLDLEKLRFQERFSYEINTGTGVDAGSIIIPNMIIQPFVENSLWHGIIDSGNNGLLTVSFSFRDVDIDSMICSSLIIKITDNGIGIREAKKNKKEDHISKGIQIIEERLRLLSVKMQLPKPIMFEDLSSRNNNSRGTEVIISLPPPLYKIINPESDPISPSTLTD